MQKKIETVCKDRHYKNWFAQFGEKSVKNSEKIEMLIFWSFFGLLWIFCPESQISLGRFKQSWQNLKKNRSLKI